MAKQSPSTQKSPAKSFRDTGTPQGTERTGSQAGEQRGRTTQPTRDQPQMAQKDSTPAGMNRNQYVVAESAIAERAYEIWKSQGGSDLDNWLKAEHELRNQNSARM